ncbi:MAG TPA: hypothetical protein DCQ50_13790 [Chryseobacterium sp.]|jgi:hypothetical protein|nr:hypothetical protein [Chryseobacterium sp.]
MKTKNYSLSALAMLFCLFVLSLNSCKKESDTNSTYQSTNNVTTKSQDVPMRTLYWAGDFPLGCAEPATNCLPTVIITPPQKSLNITLKVAHNDFIEKFKNNKVADFFNNGDYLTLFPQITKLPDALDGLRKSNIVLYHKIGATDGLDYYIGLPKDVKFSSDWHGLEKCVFVINNK